MSYFCESCQKEVSNKNKNRHNKSFAHLKNINIEDEDIEDNEDVDEDEDNLSVNTNMSDMTTVVQDDFLNELNNVNFVNREPEVILPKLVKPKLMREPKPPKFTKKEDEDEDGLFSNTGTEILGKNKHLLLNKIKNYKQLFKKELAKFKIKKGASESELQEYLDEIEILLSCSNADAFLTESVLASLKSIEPFTANTRFNLIGLSDNLKMNPQFVSLSRQLYVKYGSFINLPPEYQLVLVIIGTSYITIQQNSGKAQMNTFLNQQPVR